MARIDKIYPDWLNFMRAENCMQQEFKNIKNAERHIDET